MHVLITGINGYIAQYLLKYKPACITACGTYHKAYSFKSNIHQVSLDLTRNVASQLKDLKVDVVIHAAAVSNLSFCEHNPLLAARVNSAATKELADWCHQRGTRLIYLSTDIVFDGKKAPYSENDIPQPVNIYGKSKYEGEQAVATYEINSIARLSLVLGRGLAYGKNFVDWIIERITNDQMIPLFYDEIRTPVAARDVAKILWYIVLEKRHGIFHICSPESVDRFTLGKKIASHFDPDFRRFEKKSQSELEIRRPVNVSMVNNNLDYNIPSVLKNIEDLF